ncbi:MAG: hypothetical protein AAB567_01305 [Patescibacteria group bacterium]
MKKKVVDIIPPGGSRKNPLVQMPSVLTKQSKSSLFLISRGVFGVCAFLVLFFGVLHFVFAKTLISVWPQKRELQVQATIQVQVGQEKIHGEQKIIPGQILQVEKEVTRVFPASGRKWKEAKAQGVIRVYNTNGITPQSLVANTRFISQDGKLFHSKTRVTVPGGHYEKGKFIPGVLSLEVIAAESGEEYNSTPSKFSLPGLVGSPLYTKIYGESLEDMKGGLKKEVAIVKEEDLNDARARLLESLQAQTKEELSTKIPLGKILLAASLLSEIVAENSLVKAGAELDQFAYGATVRAKGILFHEEDVKVLAERILREQLGEGERLQEGTIKIEYPEKDIRQNSDAFSFRADMFAKSYHQVDLGNIQKRVGGNSKAQAINILSAYPYLAKAELSFWPFWARRVPKDQERIVVEFRL